MTSIGPALLLLFILSLFLRVDPFFTVLWFVLGMYVLARLWIRRAPRRLRVGRRFGHRAFLGDRVEVALTIRNAGRLPIPWLEVSESLPIELTATPFPDRVISLGGLETRTFTYTLLCRKRGLYTIGPLRLETGDLLGVEERRLLVEEPRQMIVYPRIVPLDELGLPTRSALVALPSRVPLFEDTTRIMGVRAYTPGDSPRRIHWTASARSGDLLVKQFQPSIARETLVCLDLDWRDYPLRRHEGPEEAIVVAASLANHGIVRERLPLGLATEALDPLLSERRRIVLPPRSERAQLMAILEVLARLEADSGASFVDLLREESVHVAWGTTMVVVTGTLDDALLETLLFLQRRGHAPVVILVQDAPGGTAQLHGIPLYRVQPTRDLALPS